jgi:hypothetical protein
MMIRRVMACPSLLQCHHGVGMGHKAFALGGFINLPVFLEKYSSDIFASIFIPSFYSNPNVAFDVPFAPDS